MDDTQVDSVISLRGVWKKCWNCSVRNLFLLSSLVAVPLGIAIGIAAEAHYDLSEFQEVHLTFPEDITLNMLRSMSVPVIMTSVVTGVPHLRVDTPIKAAVRAAVYFAVSTLMAVTTGVVQTLGMLISIYLGLTLAQLFKPGVAYGANSGEAEDEKRFTVDVLLDLMRNMFPQKLLLACFKKYKTERLEFVTHTVKPNSRLEMNHTEVQLVGRYVKGANIMGLIVFSLFLGLTLRRMGERGKFLSGIFTILRKFLIAAINVMLCYLPIGMLLTVATHSAVFCDWDTIYSLLKLVAVVVIGLIVHGAVILPTVYLLLVRDNPWPVIKGACPAILRAALTSSSSDTLPHMFRCCEDKNNIDPRISRFMLPIGTSISMDGTTIYRVIATVFVAQLSGITLNLGHLITIGVTAAVSSVVPATFPPTVTTLYVVAAVGILTREALILVFVEWLLNHCNAPVNVLGVCIGTALINKLSKKELAEREERVQGRTRSADCGDNEDEEFYQGHSSIFESTESYHTVT